jgi:predicted nucleotidyltransferase
MKTSKLIDILIEKIKKDYSNDISVLYVHGSYLRNDYHSLSDIDLFLVKKTEKGQNLSLTFILDGIGYDFWTVTWDWVEKVANYETRTPSLITEGKVLYYCNEEDLKRFNELIEKALKIDKEKYMNKAAQKIMDVYKTAFYINTLENLTKIQEEIIGFMYEISELLSLINCKSLKRQRKHFKDEILGMENIPDNFIKYYNVLFTSTQITEIRAAINYLTIETAKILDKHSEKIEKESFKDVFDGWYEEMIQHYNKIYYSCDIDDYQNALFASVELIYAFDRNFKRIGINPELPNIVDVYDYKNLCKLKKATQDHQTKFEELLVNNDINILKFNDIEEFRKYYEKL